jgi:hypothetical protein
MALGAFFDIEGALDRIPLDVMIQAAERHGIQPAIFRWICSILESRNIINTWLGETLSESEIRIYAELSFRLCWGAWLWMNFYRDSVIMIIIHRL